MDFKNLEKLPAAAARTLKPFLVKLLRISGENTVSVMAYGSVTGPDYDPKNSDINLAVFLKDVSLARLKPLLKLVRSGARKKITAPLFLTPDYVKMSLDTFPMELAAMKDTGCVLFGDDVLSGIAFDREDLRRECEYQLKGKLLTIRQAYLEQALDRRGLENLIKRSFRALAPVFQAMLGLRTGRAASLKKEDLLLAVAKEFNVDVTAFLEVLGDKKADGRIGGRDAEVFLSEFLAQLEKLSVIVDNL